MALLDKTCQTHTAQPTGELTRGCATPGRIKRTRRLRGILQATNTMGNRSNLYLTHTPENVDYQILEANNQLPFFWVLLLDQHSITDNDDLFPTEPDEDSPYRYIALSRDTLLRTANRSAQYLAKCYPQIAAEFTRFGDYIIGLSDRGTIEVDLLEITNFSSPREFRDDTLALLQRLDSLQPLSDRDQNEYIRDDPEYLIGFEDYATITPRYSEISDSYNTAAHRKTRHAASSSSDAARPSLAQTGSGARQISKAGLLVGTVPPGIIGVLAIIIGLWLLRYDNETLPGMNVLVLLVGLAVTIFAIVQYLRLRGPR